MKYLSDLVKKAYLWRSFFFQHYLKDTICRIADLKL